jgi:hypothetical protein
MRQKMRQVLLLTIGWVSLATGLIGILLPLLPTTPFLLLSAYCFSKSSKRLHDWLLNNRWFGPAIQQWEQTHTIDRQVKRRALLLTVCAFALSLFLVPLSLPGKIALGLLGLALCIYLSTLSESVSAPTHTDHE